MNLKKFISGVSALTIAASAFAGLAVTAGAADVYEIKFGTAITDADNNVTGVTPQTDFTADNTTDNTVTYGKYKLEDSVLSGNQAGGRNYNFESPVEAGEVHFSTMAKYVGGGYTFWNLMAKKSDGTDYAIVQSPTSLPSSSGETVVLRVAGTEVKASSVYTPRLVVYYHDITVDMTNRKINYSTDYASKGSSGTVSAYSTVTGTVDIPEDVVSIVGLNMPRVGSQGGNLYDSVSFYAAVPEAGSNNYTVNAVDENGAVLNELAKGAAKAGETYSVDSLAEVIKTGNDFYKLDSSITNHTAEFTMGSEDETQTVTYTKDNTIVGYAEGETIGTAASGSTYSAGGYGHVNGGNKASIGTFEAGVYSVEFYLVERGDRGFYIRTSANDVNSNVIASADINRQTPAGVKTVDFTLTETTELFVTGFTSGSTTNQSTEFDYVIVKKTGDYVPGTVAVAGEFSGDDYEGVATALTATFDIADKSVSKAYVIPTTDTITGETTEQAMPTTTDATVVFGIVVDGAIVGADAFTAYAK